MTLSARSHDHAITFDALLDVQDPDLWDWVMGHARAPRDDWQAIIDDIRVRHRL